MQVKFAHRDESAWERGELAYAAGDTLETAIKKAAEAGFKPGANGYAAFITAFSRRMRSKSPVVMPAAEKEEPIAGQAVILTPDFQRSAAV